MTIPRVLSQAPAGAAAAEPAGDPRVNHLQRLPNVLLKIISNQANTPSVAAVSLRMLEITELTRHNEWTKIYRQLQEDPLIAPYIASLGLDNPRLTGREKFQMLFEAMTAELGIPESIQGLDRFSLDLYLRLSNAANVSLERAWERMRNALIDIRVAGAALPGPDAGAAEIRAWLNDPANNAVLGAVYRLNLINCSLLVIPNEIRNFPNICSLFVGGNKIQGIGSRQLDGLAHLETLVLDHNQFGSWPADHFRGRANLHVMCCNINHPNELVPPSLF